MKIDVISLGFIETNCYLLSTQSAAIVIDPGFDSDIVTDFLKKNSDKERLILLTHAHFDHISGACSLREQTDTKIAIGRLDNPALANPQYNLSDEFGVSLMPFSADALLDDNDELSVGDITFKVFYTPGHTVGSVSYLIDNVIFSGDTLFAGSIGRTDFYGGDFLALKASVEKLYSLDDNTVVLSGHGEKTTIGYEKNNNPFFRG